MAYTKIVSIGSACFVASEMRHYGKRFESLPFDWIESNLELIKQAIMEPDIAFDNSIGKWYRNEPYVKYDISGGFEQIRIAHHEHSKHHDTFQRAWQRWKETLNSDDKILFLHVNVSQTEKEANVIEKQIQLLKDVVKELKCYDLEFHVVSLQPFLVDNIQNVKQCHVYLEEPNLTIIQPCFTVPLTFHWLVERDIWDKIWTDIFIKFPLNLPKTETLQFHDES
jgi:hypothetical protein